MCVLRVQLCGQLPLTLIIDTDSLTGSYLRKICGARGLEVMAAQPGPRCDNYTAGQISICVSWLSVGGERESGHLYG